MRKNYSNSKRGFTLIELIIVVAIIAIIAFIAIPNFLGFIERSRMAADQANVRILNVSTPLYRTDNPELDPFEDIGVSSESLVSLLVEGGYISSTVKPLKAQTKDAEFEWRFDEEKWYLSGLYYKITFADGFNWFNKNMLDGSYTGSSKDIVIPVSMNDNDITAIYQDVFKGKNLIALKFANDSKVVQIHARAFQNNDLTSIILPDSLKEIHTHSFENNKLTEVAFPPSLTLIQDHAFANNNLTEIELPESVTTIQGYAFENNKGLEKITILGSGTVIGVGAFDKSSTNKSTQSFQDAYAAGGAGTYTLSGKVWTKQEP